MLLRTVFIAAFLVSQVVAGPLDTVENTKAVECAVCQFLGASTAVRSGADRGESVAHCLRFEQCEKEQSDCEIIATLHNEISKLTGHFEKVKPLIQEAAGKCQADSKALVISDSATSTKCMLCFLVYDVLKYINYNILENPMLGAVKTAVEAACIIANENLCQALLQPDTFGAIVRGLQDSLGGFYDLIAVQGFGCVPYTDLFGQC